MTSGDVGDRKESDQKPVPVILLEREKSSMVSCWTELLCIESLEARRWLLFTGAHEWLGSIYELVPEDERYDENGEMVVPEFHNGQRIIGLADGEYLETDEIVVGNDGSCEFGPEELDKAAEYCRNAGWDTQKSFDQAWEKLLALVRT